MLYCGFTKTTPSLLDQPLVSVIIPTLNEAVGIRDLLVYLRRILKDYPHEIILVDGGSSDDTLQQAGTLADQLVHAKTGRSSQMNAGAQAANGQYFYFLHADTFPPEDLANQFQTLFTSDCSCGCFQLAFTDPSLLLRQSSWFTRFKSTTFRFGDASLIVSKTAFEQVNGYDESFLLMEGNDIIRRLKRQYKFRVLNAKVTTSSRKYQRYGHWYLQLLYIMIFLLQRLGVSQPKLKQLLDFGLKR